MKTLRFPTYSARKILFLGLFVFCLLERKVMRICCSSMGASRMSICVCVWFVCALFRSIPPVLKVQLEDQMCILHGHLQ